MKKIVLYSLAILITSCSTLKKTIIYSAASGSLAGGFIGRSASPDQKSKNFNMAIGALAGAVITAASGYFFWKDANPELKLKVPHLPEQRRVLPPLEDPSLSFKNLGIPGNMIPVGDKKYLPIGKETPKEVKESTKRQYYRKYRTRKQKIIDGNKVFVIPSYEVIESGIE